MIITMPLQLQVVTFHKLLRIPKTHQVFNRCSINRYTIKDSQPRNVSKKTSIIRTITVKELMSLPKTVVTVELQLQLPRKINNLT